MESLFENRNIIGYVLLVALAAVIILRLQSSRHHAEDDPTRRRPAAERLQALRRAAEEPSNDEKLKVPGKRMSFGHARLQFYVMLAAVTAIVAVWLLHRHL